MDFAFYLQYATQSPMTWLVMQVNALLPDGPAAQSGSISVGDQLISVDGTLVDTLSDSECQRQLVQSKLFMRFCLDTVDMLHAPVQGISLAASACCVWQRNWHASFWVILVPTYDLA